ncbi:MAG: nucleotidyltransferase domain-containing protein [Acidimicrobiia bacterium]|nr:nucleotidyltransferase domain-containing protein [Acidimicrobiia bacterium]
MAVSDRLPADIDKRLVTLDDAIARASEDVEFAYLFGSTSTGRRTARSDVDVAIHVREDADAQTVRLDVIRAISAALGTDAVDVVLLNTAPIALSGRVLVSRRVVLDRAPFERHRYESRIARLFHDFRIREHRLLAERHARG